MFLSFCSFSDVSLLSEHIVVAFLLFSEVDRMFCMVLTQLIRELEILECNIFLKILLYCRNDPFLHLFNYYLSL